MFVSLKAAIILCDGIAKNGKPCHGQRGHGGSHGNRYCPRHPENLKAKGQHKCSTCVAIIHYQNRQQWNSTPESKAEHAEYLYKRKRNRATRRRHFLDAYKETMGCARCPESRLDCLQFHHRVPVLRKSDAHSRAREISSMTGRGVALSSILVEIEKCDVLCANCHALETAKLMREICEERRRAREPK
jgi:hypothetical protein